MVNEWSDGQECHNHRSPLLIAELRITQKRLPTLVSLDAHIYYSFFCKKKMKHCDTILFIYVLPSVYGKGEVYYQWPLSQPPHTRAAIHRRPLWILYTSSFSSFSIIYLHVLPWQSSATILALGGRDRTDCRTFSRRLGAHPPWQAQTHVPTQQGYGRSYRYY